MREMTTFWHRLRIWLVWDVTWAAAKPLRIIAMAPFFFGPGLHRQGRGWLRLSLERLYGHWHVGY